jgi:peptidoglycan hydrolase-like protein with peptidoglycan-binding domain
VLIEFEKEYMDKYWKIQTAQWCNYFENENYNLSEIDADIYDTVKLFSKQVQPIDRKSKIASLLMQKDLVDKDPLVSEIRNRIDNLDNYNDNISEDIKANRYQYKLALSYKMKDDVKELMNTRNALSKQMGFDSYPDLVLTTEEIDKDNLIHSLNEFLESNLPKAIEIIKKYNIKWETWFSDLSRLGVTKNQYDPIELVDQLLKTFGFDEIKRKIQISFMEKGYAGCAAELSPNDIKIVVEPIKSLNNLRTLFHEMGHAILYSLNKEEGIYKILPPSHDEAMAVVIEYIAPMLLMLNKTDREKIFEIITLEYTRCAISSLYEFDLWQNPEIAEELYIKHYSRLGVEINNPSMWASDTFRSIDPVYVHNYVIGAMLSEKVFTYLQSKNSCNYKEWGAWLIDNIYKDGRKKSFKEKIRVLGDFI